MIILDCLVHIQPIRVDFWLNFQNMTRIQTGHHLPATLLFQSHHLLQDLCNRFSPALFSSTLFYHSLFKCSNQSLSSHLSQLRSLLRSEATSGLPLPSEKKPGPFSGREALHDLSGCGLTTASSKRRTGNGSIPISRCQFM